MAKVSAQIAQHIKSKSPGIRIYLEYTRTASWQYACIWICQEEQDMRNVAFAVTFAFVFTVLAMATQAENHNMAMMQNCPMQISGAEVSTMDSRDGVTVTITTKSGEVAELRRRVAVMGKMHSEQSNKETHGNMMPFSAVFEDVAGGARLVLTPRDPARLEEFRSSVRKHTDMMKKGDCSMMHGMMNGMPSPDHHPEEGGK
jgi:hypothetical protein